MNTSINTNISNTLELASRYINLGIESLNSHIELLSAGSSKDSFLYVRSKMVDYLESLNKKIRILNNTVPSKINIVNSVIVFKDKMSLNNYTSENEICLSALYNLQSISCELDNLIFSSSLDNDSNLLLYEIIESFKNDFKYLKDSILVTSSL